MRRAQDVVAAGYDAMHARYAAWAAEIVDEPREMYVARLLSLLPAAPDILELGCGAGVEPTPALAARGTLFGVDVSALQLEHARAALPAARFIHADLTSVSFDPEAFDAVVALYVLTHVPTDELPGLLRRVGRWLRPGGVLLATFGAGGPHDTFVDDFLGVPMFFSGSEPATNEELVLHAGMAVLESRLESILEPESEPGRGPETATFHWILAQRAR
jgi:SAM-dependent methyltransferase